MNKFINIRTTSFFFFLIFSFSTLPAQDTKSRMDEDLKMMKKVLNEVFRSGNPDKERLQVRAKYSDAQYIEGFGILLRTPLFYESGRNYIRLNGVATNSAQALVIGANTTDTVEYSEAPEGILNKQGEISRDKIDAEKIKLMTYFLMNYGDLAKELPKNEKIMLVYGNRETQSRTISVFPGQDNVQIKGERPPGTITMSVDKNEIDRFRAKDLSEEAFKKALYIENLAPNSEKKMAYNILGGILKDLVSEHKIVSGSELDEFYIARGYVAAGYNSKTKLNHEVLPGYGVVYNLALRGDIYGILKGGRRGRIKRSIEDDKSSQSMRDKGVDSIYQVLVPKLQEAMIEYGRTLRDLKSGEWLSVSLKIPSCEACEAPSVIEINVPQKTLEAYDSRSISLDTAISRMDVRAKGKAKESKSSSYIYFDSTWDQNPDED
ncbi:MAG: hypothetical protein AAF696_09450 [Bacteroidota bacterium]